MFPQVQRAFSREELDDLGKKLRERKQALLRSPIGRIARAMRKALRKVA